MGGTPRIDGLEGKSLWKSFEIDACRGTPIIRKAPSPGDFSA